MRHFRKAKDKIKEYSLLSNMKFHLLSAKAWDKKLFYFQILAVIPSVCSGYLGALIPSEIVRILEEKQNWETIVFKILLLVLCLFTCDILYQTMNQYLYRNGMSLTLYYEGKCFEKMMKIDYDRIEQPKNQEIIGNAWNVLRNEYAIRNSVTGTPQLLITIIGSLWYGVMVALKSPLSIAVWICSSLISFKLLTVIRKVYEKKNREIGMYASRASYINRQAMDRAAGKDIRLYQMQDWLLGKYTGAIKSMEKIYSYIHNSYFGRWVLENLLKYGAELVVYGHFLYMLLNGKITASMFVLYIGLITTFSNNFNGLIDGIQQLNPVHVSIRHIRQFLDLEEQAKRGEGNIHIPVKEKQGVKVELRNVTFTYPGKDKPTLENINLTIHPGERLALIGLNGAGKTTLVKLICGFYHPTKGEILINDIPALEYPRDKYTELISALFQDSSFFPLSLDTNLVGTGEQKNVSLLQKALELSGFKSRYDELPGKGDTLLVREVNSDATDFSGGEKQKFLFARAIYKQAPLLILDEPTAALDPIAENELYQKYSEVTKDRTTIFISHRLSSTRFCDRIILLEGAEIREEGTHEELMDKNGRYADLYKLQSQYYNDAPETGEVS